MREGRGGEARCINFLGSMALGLGKLHFYLQIKLRNRDYEYEFSVSLTVLVYWKSLTILAKADYSGNRTDLKKILNCDKFHACNGMKIALSTL